MQSILPSLRIALATIAGCVVGYTALVLGLARVIAPASARGSLVLAADGTIVGSRIIAQSFVRPEHFWPRPSAVDYDGSAAGGSNESPTSPELRRRAEELIARYGASPERPLPPELATASGGGLDPHLSERAALYQAQRVGRARGLPPGEVEALVRAHARPAAAGLARERIVNVLELNLALAASGAPQ